jgi:hypothetical protein
VHRVTIICSHLAVLGGMGYKFDATWLQCNKGLFYATHGQQYFRHQSVLRKVTFQTSDHFPEIQ